MSCDSLESRLSSLASHLRMNSSPLDLTLVAGRCTLARVYIMLQVDPGVSKLVHHIAAGTGCSSAYTIALKIWESAPRELQHMWSAFYLPPVPRDATIVRARDLLLHTLGVEVESET